MNSKIIAVDFDGTLCENKWPEIGEANEDMIYYLRKRQAEGDKLILSQSAAKCCGKKLDSLQDIARVIQEEIKEKEFNDQN